MALGIIDYRFTSDGFEARPCFRYPRFADGVWPDICSKAIAILTGPAIGFNKYGTHGIPTMRRIAGTPVSLRATI
jgi:hypothetical protein